MVLIELIEMMQLILASFVIELPLSDNKTYFKLEIVPVGVPPW